MLLTVLINIQPASTSILNDLSPLLDSDLLCYITIAHMYDLLEKCREKLNSTFSYIISIFGDGLKKRVIYHLLL